LYDQLKIVRRNWIIQGGLVAPDRATLPTFVNHNPTLFAGILHTNRTERSAAIAGTVAGKFIDMQAR
jgi:hypothetical protein